jgi:biopolymer transport protein TolR
MAVGRRKSARVRADLPMNAEIDVTSLVDVAFTLLIIFIITAPILQGGIEVAVPRANVQALTDLDAPFMITLTADGRIFMEETEVSLAELETSLPQLVAAGSIERVYIRGDSLSTYGTAIQVLAITSNSGVPASLVAEPSMREN